MRYYSREREKDNNTVFRRNHIPGHRLLVFDAAELLSLRKTETGPATSETQPGVKARSPSVVYAT